MISTKSNLEEQFLLFLKSENIELPRREFRFHPTRRWRADFAWVDEKLLVEIEGGNWSHGRHTRGAGFEEDCIKYNAAALLGYTVLRFTGNLVENGYAVECVKIFLEERPLDLRS